MKKIFVSALLLTAGLLSSAQVVTVKSVNKVTLPQGITADAPVISPDGNSVAFKQLGNDALQCVDLKTGKTVKISDNGMSYDLSFTEDGKKVIYRQRTINKNGLSYTSLKAVNSTGGGETELVKATRNLEGVAVNGTNVTTIEKKKARNKNLGSVKAESRPTVSIQQGHLNVTVNGKTTTIDPQGRGSYLWPQVSPDGKKIVYWAAYMGCFVCDIDGSNPVRLGELRAAKWLDNNSVIGMLDSDNGEYLVSSRLIAKTLDGKKQVITPSDMIAIYPSVNADGSKVAFSTEKGELYILELVK